MPDQESDRREFASSLLDLFVQFQQDQRLELMRAGTVASVGDELTALVGAQIAETETSIAALRGVEALSGPLGDALAAGSRERLAVLKTVKADLDRVVHELQTQPASPPAPTAAASGHCPRCGNPSTGGLCTGCLSHDRFVDEDRLAYDRELADRDNRRVQDDYLRDQQTWFDNQDSWRDD